MDNGLHPEGEFTQRQEQVWVQGERSQVVRRGDSLQLEGDFQERLEVRVHVDTDVTNKK